MDLERALETQRLRLLRLLAGLVFIVGFLSVAPVAPAWSRWVRGFVASAVCRLEAAVSGLVFVQACVIAKRRGDDGRWIQFAKPSAKGVLAPSSDDVPPPSVAALRRRVLGLCRQLENLSHHGERLFLRLKKKAARVAESLSDGVAFDIWMACRDLDRLISARQWTVPKIWRPPDTHERRARQRSSQAVI